VSIDQQLSGRHPFQLLMLGLVLVTGIPTVFGAAPRPGSINEQLPAWLAFGWALTITVFAAMSLLGVYWRDRATGLIMEQLGLGIVGLGTGVYIVCAVVTVGTFPISLGITTGFSVACLWRYFQLRRIIKTVRVIEEHQT
jgi:hypothetical protein